MIYLLSLFMGAFVAALVLAVLGGGVTALRLFQLLPLDRRLWWTFASVVTCFCARQIALAENDFEVPTARESRAMFDAFVWGGYLGTFILWLLGLLALNWIGRKTASEPVATFTWVIALVVSAVFLFLSIDQSGAKRESIVAKQDSIAQATIDGDVAAIRALRNAGEDLGESFAALDGKTPFGYAIAHQQKDVIEYFLSLPESDRPDLAVYADRLMLTQDKEIIEMLFDAGGRTPEFLGRMANIAVGVEAPLAFEYALSLGGDPNHMYSFTALMLAARSNQVDYAKKLIDAGADVNQTHQSSWGDSNQTALFMAAERGHIEIMNLLLEHDADPSIRDKEGRTALDIARQFEQADAVSLLEDLNGS